MVENALDILISTDLLPYFAALVLVTILIVLAAINEPPPGRTPAWVYAILGIVLTFGCGSIFNALITSIQEPQQAGTFLFAIIGTALILFFIVLTRFIKK